jgi:LysM repeat protein
MKTRFSLVVLLCVLVVLAMTAAACEKERPAPTPVGTPAPGAATTPGSQTPAPNATTLALPTPLGAGAVVTGTAAANAATGAQSGGAAPGSGGSAGSFTYTVEKGDTLAQIARKFNVTAESIVNLNQLTDPNVLMLGQELKIPGQSTAASGGYTVQPGDTLSSIAQKLGVSTTDLANANNISDPNQLRAGQVLQVPGAATGTTAAPAAGASTAGGSKTYTVQKGDTLFNIAVRYGVTTAALQQANNLTNPNQIYVGQKLVIP